MIYLEIWPLIHFIGIKYGPRYSPDAVLWPSSTIGLPADNAIGYIQSKTYVISGGKQILYLCFIHSHQLVSTLFISPATISQVLSLFPMTYYSPCTCGEILFTLGMFFFQMKTVLIYSSSSVFLHRSLPLLITDGFTHWSLTGTTVTDEDTFMGFSDGLSQSGVTPSSGLTFQLYRTRRTRWCRPPEMFRPSYRS